MVFAESEICEAVSGIANVPLPFNASTLLVRQQEWCPACKTSDAAGNQYFTSVPREPSSSWENWPVTTEPPIYLYCRFSYYTTHLILRRAGLDGTVLKSRSFYYIFSYVLFWL